MNLQEYLPQRINSGPWLTAHTLERLQALDDQAEIVLPVCSLGTPWNRLAELGEWVLPPLYHEALDPALRANLLAQIERCFPYHERAPDRRAAGPRLRVVELPRRATRVNKVRVLAFSVDTAVEEHGPHLPLATDTIQSYGVLTRLAAEREALQLAPPVEYGQLTWGLPFGFSIDVTAPLLSDYVTRFVDALLDWMQPEALYVVDVHGSSVHRQAIVEGLKRSGARRWYFRWLHEPLVEFASQRGDQHAGGVETALVEYINAELVDRAWWPARLEELAARQLDFAAAVALTPRLADFFEAVEQRSLNGIVGDIRNYQRVDAAVMFERMLSTARADIDALLSGQQQQSAGFEGW